MELKIPNSYDWFSKLNLIKFIPWRFDKNIDPNYFANERFDIESLGSRKLLTFGRQQGQDTFAGFEIIDDQLTDKVIVFHPSFQKNTSDWDIIESEHSDFFDFMAKRVLPDMKDWIPTDDVTDYID